MSCQEPSVIVLRHASPRTVVLTHPSSTEFTNVEVFPNLLLQEMKNLLTSCHKNFSNNRSGSNRTRFVKGFKIITISCRSSHPPVCCLRPGPLTRETRSIHFRAMPRCFYRPTLRKQVLGLGRDACRRDWVVFLDSGCNEQFCLFIAGTAA